MEELADRRALRRWRDGLPATCRVGFVPTMGALHAGHAALLRRAVAENDVAVASVFVNPIQFDEEGDFRRYPRPVEADRALLEDRGVAAVYLPDDADMYPPGFDTRVEPGAAAADFEGACRPGHFRGVLTVVLKLLLRVRPHRAYFGRKDAQQLFLVGRMVADLDLPVEIVPCPTVREADGLALSSRNRLLSAEDRRRATVLYRALEAARRLHREGEQDPEALEAAMARVYAAAGIEPEYAAVVEERSFRRPVGGGGPWRAVTAARVGGVRLIDNLALGEEET